MKKEIPQQLVDKLQKIQALIDNGINGEKDAAKIAFDRLIAKYNLSSDDLLDVNLCEQVFSYYYELEINLFKFIYKMIVGISIKESNAEIYRVDKRSFKVKMTKLDAIACFAAYEYFRHHFAKQLKPLLKAFNANKLKAGDKAARRNARKIIKDNFYINYVISSGLANQNDFGADKSQRMPPSFVVDLANTEPEPGKYNTQLSTILELGQ